MKRLVLLVCLGVLSLGLGAINKESQQASYNLAFKAFGKNMNAYNNFVKKECYENPIFLDDCFTYMEKLNLISNDKEQFLELVNLLSEPFIENGTRFRDSFQPNNKKINNFLRIVNQSLIDLSNSLSYIYSSDQNFTNRTKLLELNQILIALNGSINETLNQEQQLRW